VHILWLLPDQEIQPRPQIAVQIVTDKLDAASIGSSTIFLRRSMLSLEASISSALSRNCKFGGMLLEFECFPFCFVGFRLKSFGARIVQFERIINKSRNADGEIFTF
jgi:hypothetical protein